MKIQFKLKKDTKTCYRFEAGERQEQITLYLKKKQVDDAGIDPNKGITVTIEEEQKMTKVEITGTTPLELFGTIGAMGMYLMADKTVYDEAKRIMSANITPDPTLAAAPATTISATAPVAPPQQTYTSQAAPVTPTPVAASVHSAPAVQAAAYPTAAQVQQTAPAPTAAPPTYTREQISKAGADLIAQNPAKMGELLALLSQYGAQAITELKEDQLGFFALALRGLGARI